jgi:MinD-like ATPase involved in chromosome partitioning or flagellar assembly
MTIAGAAYYTGVTGIVATAASAVIDPGTLKELGSLPIGIASLLVAAYAVHTAYRQALRSSEAQERAAKAVQELATKLAERPCIRHREND